MLTLFYFKLLLKILYKLKMRTNVGNHLYTSLGNWWTLRAGVKGHSLLLWVNYQFVCYLLLCSILFGHSRFDRHVCDSNVKIIALTFNTIRHTRWSIVLIPRT